MDFPHMVADLPFMEEEEGLCRSGSEQEDDILENLSRLAAGYNLSRQSTA
jgi:hypothetical protein